MTGDTKLVAVRLPATMQREVASAAAALHSTVSSVIRIAIDRQLQEMRNGSVRLGSRTTKAGARR